MSYITIADADALIRGGVLADITEEDPLLFAAAAEWAVGEAASYISTRFDTAAEFAKTGTARDPALVMRLVDMTLYHLHTRLSPDQIPQHRRDRYETAIDWFQRVARRELTPPSLAPLPQPLGQSLIYGSTPPRITNF